MLNESHVVFLGPVKHCLDPLLRRIRFKIVGTWRIKYTEVMGILMENSDPRKLKIMVWLTFRHLEAGAQDQPDTQEERRLCFLSAIDGDKIHTSYQNWIPNKVNTKDDWVSYPDSLIESGLTKETYQERNITYSAIILSLVALRDVKCAISAQHSGEEPGPETE